jgi:putative endonuclease
LNRRARGIEGEAVALGFLRDAGYRSIERNVRTRFGEIDLVMEHAGTIVFVEVRSRASFRFGTALESVDRRKQQRLARLAESYLSHHRLEGRRARFDVVAVEWQDGVPNVRHVANAFEFQRS